MSAGKVARSFRSGRASDEVAHFKNAKPLPNVTANTAATIHMRETNLELMVVMGSLSSWHLSGGEFVPHVEMHHASVR